MVGLSASAWQPQAAIPFMLGIRAYADPNALSRVLDIFAQRGMIPTQVCCRRAGSHLVIDIELPFLRDDPIAAPLVEKIRSMSLVVRADCVSQ